MSKGKTQNLQINPVPPEISKEAQEKLETYHALLIKWQKAVNLVSNNSIEKAWERHFNDSIQIGFYIPGNTQTLIDFGSGAGFPGLVLAITRPELEVHLIESDEKKCEFLRTVSRETNTPISIHNTRIENLDPGQIRPDIITARALASLEKLCDYCRPFAAENSALTMLFLKGEKLEEEISEAQKSYDFTYEIFQSRTEKKAGIIKISGLKNRVNS